MKFKQISGTLLMVAAGVAIIFLSTVLTENRKPELKNSIVYDTIPNTVVYGIVIDSLLVIKDKVRKNQFLSDILSSYRVDYPTIDLLTRKSLLVFDVRKIRAGNNYTALCSNDSVRQLKYLIYEDSPSSYVVFDLNDSIHVHTGEKEIKATIKTASGVIRSSLWDAMVECNTDPELALELSDVYAWTIDFFGIQKGDYFKVIYEELSVEDKFIGFGRIHSAIFNNEGRDYFAFYFVQEDQGDYFDDKGQSLRRTFLKAPLHFKRISSHYSHSRMHPILKVRRPHLGVDYAADYGTPVQTVGDGTVVSAGRDGAAGNMVKIRHNGTYTTAYLHLSKFGPGIRKGAHVRQGDVVGYVGSSGRSTGPHLDFRFYQNGSPVDPLKVQSPPAEPVKASYLSEYWKTVAEYKTKLDSIQTPPKLSGVANR
jgi:murein DD-endopeptidase MepM/ murein hydrolase activator NlpD